ncbi:MAG: hypothetical protein WB803_13285, partial [Pseudolabrys sp.]
AHNEAMPLVEIKIPNAANINASTCVTISSKLMGAKRQCTIKGSMAQSRFHGSSAFRLGDQAFPFLSLMLRDDRQIGY